MPKQNTYLRLQSLTSHIWHWPFWLILGGLLLVQAALSAKLSSKTLDQTMAETELMHQQGAQSQSVILKSKNIAQQLLAEFRALNNELDQLKINQAHALQTQAQQSLTINSLHQQLNEIEVTEKAIVPQLLSMVDWLAAFVDRDIPFYSEERQQRITYLKSSMIDPDVNLPERYRRVLEAYQVESEYGYTIESYPHTISIDGERLQVSMLKVGRVGLYYQSEDGHLSGYWHTQKRQWQAGHQDLAEEVKKGLLIAQKQRPHTLLTLPVVKTK